MAQKDQIAHMKDYIDLRVYSNVKSFPMRLNKALSSITSRRGAEKLVLEGRVTLNGQRVSHPAIAVDPERDVLCVDGERVAQKKKFYYFLVNKPAGYLCTATPGFAKRVLDLFSHIPERLFTVGRLDQDTTGLLLVTNDGSFAQQLIHPSNEHLKEYLIKVSQEITEDHLRTLAAGTVIDRTHVTPVHLEKVRRGTLKMILAEGKRHEVRELVLRAGLNLLELKRIRVGPFLLGNLGEGQYRELSLAELRDFGVMPN